MATTASAEAAATAQNADRHPHCCPSSAPPGTPATQARVTPPSTTDIARPWASAAAALTAAPVATAQKPALARALITRVSRSTS